MSYPTLSQIEQPTFMYTPPKEPVNPNLVPGGDAFYLTNQGNTLASRINTTDPLYTDNMSGIMQQQHLLSGFTQPTETSFTNEFLKPVMQGINGIATLGNLWLGFKNYGMAKKQLGLAQQQWNQTKDELNRIKTLRTKLTNSYMNGE